MKNGIRGNDTRADTADGRSTITFQRRVLVALLWGLATFFSSMPQARGGPETTPVESNPVDTGLPLTESEREAENSFSFFDSLRHGARGISITPAYTGEVFTNTRGGLSTKGSTQYLGLVEIPVKLDFEKMGFRSPGRLFLLGQNTHGEGISKQFVGDSLFISNIDSLLNITRIGEYWWETDFLDGDITLRLGKQDVNTNFLRIDTANDFIQSTFGLTPSTAFPTYPNQSMAAVLLSRLTESLVAKVGVWDAFYEGGSSGISGNGSIFVASELEYSYTLSDGTLPGKWAAAFTYESAGELSGEPISEVFEYGVQIEQSLYREIPGDEDDAQGLVFFAGYYPRFPGALIPEASIGDSLVAGLVSVGLFRQRDEDVIGVGVAWVELFAGGTGQETVVECFYKANINPRLYLQPDLQYIASPSGIYPDALAVGLRFGLTW